MTNEEFVETANPHSWFLVADDLHYQAKILMQNFGTRTLTRRDLTTGDSISWDNSNRAVFLLASFALENAIKAFLVYDHPGWISNGTLSKHLKTHSLTKLSKMSNLVPYKQRSQAILKIFEDGNESWARYPCSLKKDFTREPLILDHELWCGYLWLMKAYGKKLINLLSKRWDGPHGFSGHYNIDGTFFDNHINHAKD